MSIELGNAAMGIFVGGFVIAILLVILAQTESIVASMHGVDVTNTATWTTAYNATIAVTAAVNLFIDFLPVIVLAIVGVLVLGYVVGGFGQTSGGGRRGSGRRMRKRRKR